MNTDRRIVRNFAISFSGSVLGQALFFLGLIWVARRLGPEAFGWWSFSQAIVFYLLRAGELGLEVHGIRVIAGEPHRLSKHASQVILTRVMLAAILISVAAMLGWTGALPTESRVLVILFSVTLVPMAALVEWIFEGIQRVTPIAQGRLLRGSLFAALAYAFVFDASDAISAAWIYVAAVSFPSLFLLWRARKVARLRIDWSVGLSGMAHLRESWPIGLATLFSQFSLFLGTTLLGYVGTAEDLGVFSSAQRIVVFIWAYGIVTSNRILLAPLSSYARSSATEFSSLISKATRVLVVMAMCLGLLIFSVATSIIPLIFGDDYVAGGELLSILIWVLVAGISRSAIEVAVNAAGMHRRFLTIMAVLAGVHAVFDPIGYAIGGVSGLAWGALAAEGTYTVWLFASVGKGWISDIRGDLLKPAVLGVPVLIGLVLAQSFGVTVSLLLAGVYPVLLVWTGIVDRGNLVGLREALRFSPRGDSGAS